MKITKEEFITRLKLVIMADERSCVKDITYWKQDEKEIVTIHYVGGAKALINVACNSNGCNALEIMREIYGFGAIGKIREEGITGRRLVTWTISWGGVSIAEKR